jgi:hypothetical protein
MKRLLIGMMFPFSVSRIRHKLLRVSFLAFCVILILSVGVQATEIGNHTNGSLTTQGVAVGDIAGIRITMTEAGTFDSIYIYSRSWLSSEPTGKFYVYSDSANALAIPVPGHCLAKSTSTAVAPTQTNSPGWKGGAVSASATATSYWILFQPEVAASAVDVWEISATDGSWCTGAVSEPSVGGGAFVPTNTLSYTMSAYAVYHTGSGSTAKGIKAKNCSMTKCKLGGS